MNIVALVTGRGNNTLKDKNVLNVLGRPLMYYPCAAAKRSSLISDFYVSSDDEKILACGESLGFKRIERPVELATPTSQHVDAIRHALGRMRDAGCVPDILVVLLANNATVKTEWIDASIRKILNDETVSSVCPVEQDQDHHPFRAKTVDEDGNLRTFFDFGSRVSTNRQDLPPCYFLCHNFWTLNVRRSVDSEEEGQPPWNFLGNKIRPIVVSGCFDVHSEDDIARTENWIRSNVMR